jgi:hypothetical protein
MKAFDINQGPQDEVKQPKIVQPKRRIIEEEPETEIIDVEVTQEDMIAAGIDPWAHVPNEERPWQEREPWRTIKKGLPRHMIDTPEKEYKTAWRIGFLLGYECANFVGYMFREFGFVRGCETVATLTWAWNYAKNTGQQAKFLLNPPWRR